MKHLRSDVHEKFTTNWLQWNVIKDIDMWLGAMSELTKRFREPSMRKQDIQPLAMVCNMECVSSKIWFGDRDMKNLPTNSLKRFIE